MPRITHPFPFMALGTVCIVGFLAVVISACAPRYSVFVGEYESEIERINNVVLIHDATILSAISHYNHLVHREKSIETLSWVNDSITEIVTEKGYKVSDRTVWSVGLTFEPETSVVVFQGTADEVPDSKKMADVKRVHIPVYLHSTGFNNESISTISDLHWPLSWLKDDKDWDDVVYPDVRSLELPVTSVLLFTQSVCVQVPWGAKVGQFFYSMLEQTGSTENLAMQNFLYPPKSWDSDTSVHLFAILNHEGKLLWADVFEEVGGNRGEKTLEHGLEKLFSSLPDHPNKSQKVFSGQADK